MVDLVPHLVDPSLDDDVGLCGEVVGIVQPPEISPDCRVIVVVLRGEDGAAVGVSA